MQIINPGDSFDFPDFIEQPKVFFVPSAAPWCKIAESMGYIKGVKPEIAIPFHDAISSELGNIFNNNWLKKAADEVDAKFTPLRPGEQFTID